MKQDIFKLLNPESLKQNLIRASLYLTCWEMLKQCVVEQPRDFYSHDVVNGELIPGPNYKPEVLSLHKDPLCASAEWFKKMGAISDEDLQLLQKLRDHRNLIAHELPKVLSTVDLDVNLDYFDRITYLVHKIDKWWIREIEIPTNPEFDDRTLTPEELHDVQSSRMIVLRLLVAVVKGRESELRLLYEDLKQEWKRRGWDKES